MTEIQQNLSKAEIRQNTIESNVKSVTETCTQMQHEIAELRNISDQTKTMLGRMSAPDSYEEIAEKVVENKIGVTSEKIKEMHEKVAKAKELLKEAQDKEVRTNNIIIYRVPESDGADQEDRKHDDIRFVPLCALQHVARRLAEMQQ